MPDASGQPWRPWEGASPPNHQPRKLTPQQIGEVRQALTDGATVQALALKYGVSVRTIRRYKP
ncbi:helix-turn-helix domain-containing protein [Streptomyces sp. NPDC002758]